jgi:diguanylate cyclase (GGDEF)-like protein/PAS domain S-box-containing protein/putative nucleotidyltransferase with HDIG domain
MADGGEWGNLEVLYAPSFGIGPLAFVREPFIQFFLIVTCCNGLAFFFYLRRTLQHLDPSHVVPDRVRNALDTIAEGLVVVDSRERIVLANKAFAAAVGRPASDLVGAALSSFAWYDEAGTSTSSSCPWQETVKRGIPSKGETVQLDTEESDTRCYVVNSSPIFAENGKHRGTLISFEDVTELENRRAELKRTLDILRSSRDEVRKQNEELRLLATRDPLTGCLNRRSYYESLDSHWASSERYGHPLSCIMVDVDHFKSVNDTHGHSTGDVVLQKVADALKTSVRTCDVLCRFGGEEFCVLLPHTDVEEAVATAERLRRAIAGLVLPGFSVTASLGVSAASLGATGPQEMIDQADKSLYVAKRGGRNQVVRFDPANADAFDAPAEKAGEKTRALAEEEHVEIPFHAVSALITTLAFRDASTAEHARRVADLCVIAASNLMSARECYVLETAALLHDIGKMGVPDSILLKAGPLTDEEWKIMGLHDHVGVEIIASAFACPPLTEIVENHHAWYTGNPREPGLPTGEAIPAGARLLAIADAYDAMVSDRVYRKGRTSEEAFEELRRCSGTQFDPNLVEQFIAAVQARHAGRPKTSNDLPRQAALLIGEQMERLAECLDDQDLCGLITRAERVRAAADRYQIAELATTASQLQDAAASDADLQQIATLTNDLMDLCRDTQSAFLRGVPVENGESPFDNEEDTEIDDREECLACV